MDVTSRIGIANPPSLYDTSTSTTESWSTGSAGGRRAPQQGYPSYYLPSKNRNQQPQQQSSQNVPSSRQPSASPRLSPVDWPDDFQHGDYQHHHGERAQSEPGSSNKNNDARYSTYLNRRFNQQQNKSQPRYAQSDVGGSIPEGIRRYNQQYPDPEPVVSSSGDEEEQRQASSPLQPAEERVVNRPYPSPKVTPNKFQKQTRFESQPSPKVMPSPRAQPSPRAVPSPRAQPSPRTPSRQTQPSPRAQPSPRTIPSPRTQPSLRVVPSPKAPQQQQQSLQMDHENYPDHRDSQITIETPQACSVRDLKRQLWSEDEVLQVAVPPTMTSPDERSASDRRKSFDPSRSRPASRSSQRSTRSLSPGTQRSSGSEGVFKSKFYEAALAARMRGKLHPTQIDPQDVPREVPTPSRVKYLNPDEFSYTMSTSFSDPFDENKSRGSVSQKSTRSSTPQKANHGREQQGTPNSHNKFKPSPSAASQELNRASSWAERPRYEKLQTSRQSSFADRVASFDGAESRGRIDVSNDRNHNNSNGMNTPRSQQQQPSWRGRSNDPRSSSVERRRDGSVGPKSNRERSVSRERNVDSIKAPRGRALSGDVQSKRRESSQGPSKGRSPSPFMERRMREFSSDGSQGANNGRSPSPYMEQRMKDVSSSSRNSLPASPAAPQSKAVRRGSTSSIEQLAREFSGGAVPAINNEQNNVVATPETGPATTMPQQETVAPSDIPREGKPPTPQQRASVASFWQNKAKPSSPLLPPKPSTPSPHNTRQQNMYARSNETGRQEHAVQQDPTTSVERDTMSDAQDTRDIADLVAKLSAINRANPAEALAQIDSILRNESRGSAGSSEPRTTRMANEAPSKRESPVHADRHSDPDSDDETSVSSITNPTYQSPQVHQDPIRMMEQNPNAPDNGLQKETVNFSPSTSSFRRPRPSTLQHYTTSSSHQQEAPSLPRAPAMSRTQEKRMQLKQFPPPATIRVNNQTNPPEHEDLAEPQQNIEPPHQRAEEATGSRGASPSPKSKGGKLDKFVSNQEELAAKIRVWDEMSTGGGRSKPEVSRSGSQESSRSDREEKVASPQAEATAVPRSSAPPTVAAGRKHPWDDAVLPMRPDNVNMKDTSMESAFGVEMEVGKPGKVAEFPTGKFNPSKEIPASLSSGFTGTSPANTPPAAGTNDFFNDNFAADVSTFFGRGTSPSWDVAPAATTPQQEKAQKISDEFDAAWVSMPSASFFPEDKDKVTVVQTDLQQPEVEHSWPPMSGKQSKGRLDEPGDLDQSFEHSISQKSAPEMRQGTMTQKSAPEMRLRQANEYLQQTAGRNDPLNQSGERGAIEVSLLESDYPSWGANETEQRLQVYEQPNQQTESKPKKKGFLRAFMRREKKKNVSKGAKSTSGASIGANSLPNRPQPRIATLPLPPAFDHQEMAPPRGRNHGRGSPQRGRSNSLERFRSKSMAKKFNRVMRLYDD